MPAAGVRDRPQEAGFCHSFAARGIGLRPRSAEEGRTPGALVWLREKRSVFPFRARAPGKGESAAPKRKKPGDSRMADIQRAGGLRPLCRACADGSC